MAESDRILLRPSYPARMRLPRIGRLHVHFGIPSLTQCQRRVVVLVAQGLKNREIASEIGVSVNVVRNYVQEVYDKLGLDNRVELAIWYETRVHEGWSLV